jgi:tetratricopeptide (TPR) repeat protein
MSAEFEAIETLDDTLARASETALLAKAAAAYRAGRLDAAEKRCGELLARSPGHRGGAQLLAAIAGKRGDPARGLDILDELDGAGVASTDVAVQRAALLRSAGRGVEAIVALREARRLQPDNVAALNDLGLALLAEVGAAEALEAFDAALAVAPDKAALCYNKGLALERLGQLDGALAAFARAAALAPNLAEPHAKLGDLLAIQGRKSEAVANYRRAMALRPNSIVALSSEARVCLQEGAPARALEAMQRAIALEPRNAELRGLAGALQMQLGRFLDAAFCFELAIALDRRAYYAYFQLVHVKKLGPADRPLVAQIERLLADAPLSLDDRCDLHFAAGKAHDDLGDCEKAIVHFEAANALKRAHVAVDRALHAHVTDRLAATFDAACFERHANLGSQSDRPLLIVGMPRSGTTLVEQIFRAIRRSRVVENSTSGIPPLPRFAAAPTAASPPTGSRRRARPISPRCAASLPRRAA